MKTDRSNWGVRWGEALYRIEIVTHFTLDYE